MDKLQRIFKVCQFTGSWVGLTILSVHDRNDFQDTPLHTVCTWGDIEAVKILIEAGANIEAIGDQGATPIFNALISKNKDLIQYLVKCGASKKAKIFGITTPYEYAKNAKLEKEILEILN